MTRSSTQGLRYTAGFLPMRETLDIDPAASRTASRGI